MTSKWACSGTGLCSRAGALPREASAIDLVVAHIRETGSDVVWVCSPDRLPCELRVDALLVINGVPWMVDHMRLTWDERSVPWVKEARDYLEPRLDELARSVNSRLTLHCPRIRGSSRLDRKQQLEGVIAWARQAAEDFRSGILVPLEWRTGPAPIGIQFMPVDKEATQQPLSILAFGMSLETNLASQFDLVNRPVLEGKLNGQLRKGPDRPSRCGLILDQREQDVEYFPVANGIFTVETVAGGLERLLGGASDRLDAAWFINHSGQVSQVW